VARVSARHRLLELTRVSCGDTDPGLDAPAPWQGPGKSPSDGSLSAAVAAVAAALEEKLVVVV